ncbi:uncharacterized protein BDZ83DRAFT_653105 [Colletotrichum acutatum]|uniref:Uncharacterized protein n=1 Tax=Glomerella acutata TaxID=27357 RepID=A0AAD8UHV3_GLOAC|nr:uncharacterized protein BDZ83DRAFT_653105 [Colletotrichum acutatum]KAK1723453.1 hypothetical protein BDZ83DRAFT_653105 [Colletotrichum acutatum]
MGSHNVARVPAPAPRTTDLHSPITKRLTNWSRPSARSIGRRGQIHGSDARSRERVQACFPGRKVQASEFESSDPRWLSLGLSRTRTRTTVTTTSRILESTSTLTHHNSPAYHPKQKRTWKARAKASRSSVHSDHAHLPPLPSSGPRPDQLHRSTIQYPPKLASVTLHHAAQPSWSRQPWDLKSLVKVWPI